MVSARDRLATSCGVATEFFDLGGTLRVVPETTVTHTLAALGSPGGFRGRVRRCARTPPRGALGTGPCLPCGSCASRTRTVHGCTIPRAGPADLGGTRSRRTPLRPSCEPVETHRIDDLAHRIPDSAAPDLPWGGIVCGSSRTRANASTMHWWWLPGAFRGAARLGPGRSVVLRAVTPVLGFRDLEEPSRM